jgi:hypothetical protein
MGSADVIGGSRFSSECAPSHFQELAWDVPPIRCVWSIAMNPKNLALAVRYRQLALAEPDRAKAAVLLTIADEAEKDVLCTVDSTNLGYARRDEQKIPIQSYTGS